MSSTNKPAKRQRTTNTEAALAAASVVSQPIVNTSSKKGIVMKKVVCGNGQFILAPMTPERLMVLFNSVRIKARPQARPVETVSMKDAVPFLVRQLSERQRATLGGVKHVGLAEEYVKYVLSEGLENRKALPPFVWKMNRLKDKKAEIAVQREILAAKKAAEKREGLGKAIRSFMPDQQSREKVAMVAEYMQRHNLLEKRTIISRVNGEVTKTVEKYESLKDVAAHPRFEQMLGRAVSDAPFEKRIRIRRDNMRIDLPALAGTTTVEKPLEYSSGFFYFTLSDPSDVEEITRVISGTVLDRKTLLHFDGIFTPGIPIFQIEEVEVLLPNENRAAHWAKMYAVRCPGDIYHVLNRLVQGKFVSEDAIREALVTRARRLAVDMIRKRRPEGEGVYSILGHYSNAQDHEYPMDVHTGRRLLRRLLRVGIERGVRGAKTAMAHFEKHPNATLLNGIEAGGTCYPPDSPMASDKRPIRIYKGGGTPLGITLTVAKLEGRDFDGDALPRWISYRNLADIIKTVREKQRTKLRESIPYAHKRFSTVDDGGDIWYGSLPVQDHYLTDEAKRRIALGKTSSGKGAVGEFFTLVERPMQAIALTFFTDEELISLLEKMPASIPVAHQDACGLAFNRWQESGTMRDRTAFVITLTKAVTFPAKEGLMDAGKFKVKLRDGSEIYVTIGVQKVSTVELLNGFRDGRMPFEDMKAADWHTDFYELFWRYSWITRETEEGSFPVFNPTAAIKEANPALLSYLVDDTRWGKRSQNALVTLFVSIPSLDKISEIVTVVEKAHHQGIPEEPIQVDDDRPYAVSGVDGDFENLDYVNVIHDERLLGDRVDVVVGLRNMRPETTDKDSIRLYNKELAKNPDWLPCLVLCRLGNPGPDGKCRIFQLYWIDDCTLHQSNVTFEDNDTKGAWYLKASRKEGKVKKVRVLGDYLMVEGYTPFEHVLGPNKDNQKDPVYNRNEPLKLLAFHGPAILQLIARDAFNSVEGNHTHRMDKASRAVRAFIATCPPTDSKAALALGSETIQPILKKRLSHPGWDNELRAHLLAELQCRGFDVLSCNQNSDPWYSRKVEGYSRLAMQYPGYQVANPARLSKGVSPLMNSYRLISPKENNFRYAHLDQQTTTTAFMAFFWSPIFGTDSHDEPGDEAYFSRAGRNDLATNAVEYAQVDQEGFDAWSAKVHQKVLDGDITEAQAIWLCEMAEENVEYQNGTRRIHSWNVPLNVPAPSDTAFKTTAMGYLNMMAQPLLAPWAQFYCSFNGNLSGKVTKDTDARAVHISANLYALIKKGAVEIPVVMAANHAGVTLPDVPLAQFYAKERSDAAVKCQVGPAWFEGDRNALAQGYVYPGMVKGDVMATIEEALEAKGLPADAKMFLYVSIAGRLYPRLNREMNHARVIAGDVPVRMPKYRAEGSFGEVGDTAAIPQDIRLQLGMDSEFTPDEETVWHHVGQTLITHCREDKEEYDFSDYESISSVD